MFKTILQKINGGEKKEGEIMSFERNGRTFYRTRQEVANASRRGDLIYYSEKRNAYYIRRPQNRNLFSRRWG
jgi:hypothetical protein